jgi:hypothetical protein
LAAAVRWRMMVQHRRAATKPKPSRPNDHR